ncbi:DUF3899 domain-containing protein [Planomicrobium chinense]|uniref:DUF3899 domain-containing protein n=1 Tax=Planococcus chinensis TaxID=272917 RepID=UPI001CC348E1|nr:DUF3899 domain-containing protein [Planococcus chinensis]MBZ5200677.1 DUF3899 domain-containing protein [Planococcus chinensis]
MTFKFILFTLSLIASFLMPFLLEGSWSLLYWLDSIFLTGLLLLVIASVMLLIEGRFFMAFIQSTKSFFAKINKREQVILESEKRTSHPVEYAKNFPSRKAFFQIGLLFFGVSLFLSSAIYFF